MHDVEITLDLLYQGDEPLGEYIDIMKFDGNCDDIPGMGKQVFKDAIFAPFNVHFHKYLALRRQSAECIVDGRAAALVVAPQPLFEMGPVGPEEQKVVDPCKNLRQCARPWPRDEARQLTDRILESGAKRDRVIVAMNDGARIVRLEIALE